jgi:hypothetical protein
VARLEIPTVFSKNISSRHLGKGLDANHRMGSDIEGIMFYGNTISSVDQLPIVDDTTRFYDEPDAFLRERSGLAHILLEMNDSLPSNVPHFSNGYIYCYQVYVGFGIGRPPDEVSWKKEIAAGPIRKSRLPWPEGRSLNLIKDDTTSNKLE